MLTCVGVVEVDPNAATADGENPSLELPAALGLYLNRHSWERVDALPSELTEGEGLYQLWIALAKALLWRDDYLVLLSNLKALKLLVEALKNVAGPNSYWNRAVDALLAVNSGLLGDILIGGVEYLTGLLDLSGVVKPYDVSLLNRHHRNLLFLLYPGLWGLLFKLLPFAGGAIT